MMKSLIIVLGIIGLIGLMVAPALADTPGHPGPVTLNVNITVEPYCEIELESTDVNLTLNAGNSPAALVNFTLLSNTGVNVSLRVNDPIHTLSHEGQAGQTNEYPCATLSGGSAPADSIGYWPQIKAVKTFADGTDAGLTHSEAPYDEGGGGEHGGEIWTVMFWDTGDHEISFSYSEGGTYNGAVGYSTNIRNTETGAIADTGIYEGSMTLTLTCSS